MVKKLYFHSYGQLIKKTQVCQTAVNVGGTYSPGNSKDLYWSFPFQCVNLIFRSIFALACGKPIDTSSCVELCLE